MRLTSLNNKKLHDHKTKIDIGTLLIVWRVPQVQRANILEYQTAFTVQWEIVILVHGQLKKSYAIELTVNESTIRIYYAQNPLQLYSLGLPHLWNQTLGW